MSEKDAILLDLPVPIYTPRLLLRPIQPGDGKIINEAILETFDDLHRWMSWAREKPTIEESEFYARTAVAEWIKRENLQFLMLDRQTNKFLGGAGLPRISWPEQRCEIGYWIRISAQGQGYVTEGANALTRYAFQQLNIKRLEIRCDQENVKSRNVAERLGFEHEATLKSYDLNMQGNLRNVVIYARFGIQNLPPLEAFW